MEQGKFNLLMALSDDLRKERYEIMKKIEDYLPKNVPYNYDDLVMGYYTFKFAEMQLEIGKLKVKLAEYKREAMGYPFVKDNYCDDPFHSLTPRKTTVTNITCPKCGKLRF